MTIKECNETPFIREVDEDGEGEDEDPRIKDLIYNRSCIENYIKEYIDAKANPHFEKIMLDCVKLYLRVDDFINLYKLKLVGDENYDDLFGFVTIQLLSNPLIYK